MNIISIGTDRNLFTSGSPVQKRQIEYATLFDDVHIIVFSRREHSLPEKITIAPRVWVYATNSRSRFSYISDATRIAGNIIREHGFDRATMVTTTQDPFETAAVGYSLKKNLGVPLHVQIHTDFLNPYFVSTGRMRDRALNRIRVFLAMKHLPHADSVRVVSRRIAASLESKKILPPQCHVTVLPVFVDTETIRAHPRNNNLREKYSDFKFLVLMASRFTQEKNIALGIDAFSQLSKKYPDRGLGLVIVGDGPEKSRIQNRINRLDLADTVVCEPWQNDVVSFYKTADVFLSTSWYEGFGLSMVEAALAGCVVVATDAGIAPMLTRACPPGDAHCLSRKLSELVASPELREKYTQEARAWLEGELITDKQQYFEQYRASLAAAV